MTTQQSEYKDLALTKLIESISNRRLIQHLRFQLFKKSDFQPKELVELNLNNSTIQQELYEEIDLIAQDILDLLNENVFIYKRFFIPKRCLLPIEDVRDLFLQGEEELFGWEIFYQEYLEKFITDKKRKSEDPIGYYQKIYEFILIDLSYGDIYESYV